MGFNFSFFGNQEHRVFNYKPRYYDPAKEERKRIFGKVDGSLAEDDPAPEASLREDLSAPEVPQQPASQQEPYKPGRYISGSFRDGNYQQTKMSTNRTQKLIGLVGLILFFVILYYIVQFYGFILK